MYRYNVLDILILYIYFYSFYNWDSHIALCNSSPNYQVIADNPEGLLFKYKRDRKILNVDPKVIITYLFLQNVLCFYLVKKKFKCLTPLWLGSFVCLFCILEVNDFFET